MSKSSCVAIVVLNYNTEVLLSKYLPSILATNYDNKEIWVVDNASTDGSLALLHENYLDQIKVLQTPKNLGYAGGYNWALSQINAKYYVLINSDVRVTKDWLQPLVKMAENNDQIAAIQPKILADKNPDFFEYAGASGGYLDCWGYAFCRGRIMDALEKDNNQYDSAVPIFWASGACLFVRSTAFHAVHGFDDDLFAHMEEIDLCWRLQHQGHQIYVEPQSIVYHLGGGTLSEGSSFKYFLNFRNSLIVLSKNTTSTFWMLQVLWRMVLDGLASIKFIADGKPQLIGAILKAHGAYWSTLNKTLDKRKRIQLSSKHQPKVYQRSIIWAYFILKKKKFTALKDVE